MSNFNTNLKIATLLGSVLLPGAYAHAAPQGGLVMPKLGSSAAAPTASPSLGANTTFRATPNLAPSHVPSSSSPSLPTASAPARAASTLPTYTVPRTGGYVVVGAPPNTAADKPINPGNQITVSPNRFSMPAGHNQVPQPAYGVSVTVPIGTISPRK